MDVIFTGLVEAAKVVPGPILTIFLIYQIINKVKDKKNGNGNGNGNGLGTLNSTVADLVTQGAEQKQLLVSMNSTLASLATCATTTGQCVSEMYKMHDKYDADGVPLWYTPRSWSETQKEIIEICRDIATTLVLVSKSQESIAHTMERLEEKAK